MSEERPPVSMCTPLAESIGASTLSYPSALYGRTFSCILPVSPSLAETIRGVGNHSHRYEFTHGKASS